MELEERFWQKVDWDLNDTDRCWPWMASKNKRWGYGQFRFVDLYGVQCLARAHRLAYELLIGPIDQGLQLDHICHDPTRCICGPACPHRACCNPYHLRPVDYHGNHAAARACRDGRGGRTTQQQRTAAERTAIGKHMADVVWSRPGFREESSLRTINWWANLTPEARAEQGRRISAGKLKRNRSLL